MTEFLQQLINGLALGSIYALIALGYTMVYGVLRFINFAHGDIFMVGAFFGFYLTPLIKMALPRESLALAGVVMLCSMVLCAALGILIERLAYRPLRNKPKLTVLITAIGVSLLIEYVGQHKKVFGPSPQTFPSLLPSKNFELGATSGLVINSIEVVVLAVTAALIIALQFIVHRTKLGTAMRAVSFNAPAAALMGININVVISFTFGLGSALAAAAGILYASKYPSIDPLMGVMPGLKAFVAAVLGGIGNIPGAALGGLVLGLVDTFMSGTTFSNYRDAVAFAILILILLFRPSGLLGKREVEKV
jgi:branched-chain amino acid transport system permease protein